MSTATVDTKATAPATPAPAAANPPAATAPSAAAAPNGGVGSPAGVAVAPAADAAKTAAPAAKFLLGEDAPPAEVKDGQPAAVDAKPADKAAEWKLDAPKDTEVDADTLTAVEKFAKENGLGKEAAEKILARDLAAKTAASEASKTAETQRAASIASEWASECEKHPEIGGAKLTQAVANAKRALQAFATADERKAIANSPFANNPMFIAILNRAANALPREDTVHPDSAAAASQAPVPTSKIIYGNL